MVEENDAWIERLEKESQESRAQMSEMLEVIRTLIRDKGQAPSPSPKMRQLNRTKEGKMSFIHQGLLLHMLRTSIWRKYHQCNKPEGSRMAKRLPQRR